MSTVENYKAHNIECPHCKEDFMGIKKLETLSTKLVEVTLYCESCTGESTLGLENIDGILYVAVRGNK